MNEGAIFNIGEQHAGRDIYNVARDLNITQNSSAEDILTIVKAIGQKVGELDIGEKDKKKIANQIEGAKIELEDEQPDKKTITERIKSKEGRIRHNLAGKRTNFSARTVISPDPMIALDEVGVPMILAMKLTIPERVTEWNMQYLKEFLKRW